MKRDLDYLRQILLDAEQSEQTELISPHLLSMSLEEEKYHYHVQLLCDAGYLMEKIHGLYRMTNQGHDYLDAIRDDTNWSNIATKIKPLSSVPLDVIKALGIKYLTTELGL